jgi:hypothetical protein
MFSMGGKAMSRRHHSTAPTIGKKEQERQQRQQAARQRMRLHTFTALALMLLTKSQDNDIIREDMRTLPANERRYIPMQVARCKRSCEAVVRMLNRADQWPATSSAFFEDASDKVQTLLTAVCNVLPLTCSGIDIHIVMTYLIYAALYEWQAMAQDERAEVQRMIADMHAFADHILQNDSPLLLPMNRVFWSMRDFLHSGAPLPVWDFEKHPSSAELYMRQQAQAKAA